MRLKRRGLVDAYIKVPELSKNGKQHLHVIIRGKYIPQDYLSKQWQQIHKAKIVGITRMRKGTGNRGLANYLVKYMVKDSFYRYSWSWSWVWKGFCKHWTRLKRVWRAYNELSQPVNFQTIIRLWAAFLRLKQPEPLLEYIQRWETALRIMPAQ